jgi:hypothetical protein
MDSERVELDWARDAHAYSGETINSLFQPDALLDDLYQEAFRRGAAREPEKDLMLAILEDAIKSFQENCAAVAGKKRALFEETRDWFFADDATWVFSFVSVCGALGFDADYLRKGLSRFLSRSASLN